VLLLTNGNKLRSEGEEGNIWTSRIPEIHSFEALYTSPSSTPLASNWELRAAEELQSHILKHQSIQQESLADEPPPSLSHGLNRLSSPLPVKEAPIDVCENSSAAELHSQEAPETMSSLRDQLPNAKDFPRVLLGSPSQSPALFPDPDLLPQPLSALSSPSAVPATPGTSYSLALDSASSNVKLGDYFPPMEHPRNQFTDVQCQDIARLLCESGKVSWSRVPRIYIILRIIGQLPVLDAFIDQGINDLWLPLMASSLQPALSVGCHQDFIATQPLVLTKALDLENNTKRHAHFTRDDPFPFESKGTLGSGGFAIVDRILSPLSGREFARKRFKRGKNMRKADLESFMTELNILKRLHHVHYIELVSISSACDGVAKSRELNS
jgi:hypothetical protein